MDFLNKIYNEDCIETMKRIPDGSIDLMLTDPPYNITACEWEYAINFDLLWKEWLRVVKPTGAFVFTASQPFTTDLINSNRSMFKYEIIWEKERPTNPLLCNKQILKYHENVLLFANGQNTYNPQSIRKKEFNKRKNKPRAYITDTIGKKPIYDNMCLAGKNELIYPSSIQYFTMERGLHPTQKPIDLFRYLIKTYTNEGETVFDGYMGSGTTAMACIAEKRNFVGSELNKEYFEIATKRIENEASQTKLF